VMGELVWNQKSERSEPSMKLEKAFSSAPSVALSEPLALPALEEKERSILKVLRDFLNVLILALDCSSLESA